MDFPHIHSCLKLNSENEILKKKVHRLKREKQVIEGKLKENEEKNRLANLLREYVTSRDVYVQTEPSRGGSSSSYLARKKQPEKTVEASELEKTNKLLSMHSQLMKRYEKEVKTNITHVETYRIIELERLCKEREEELKRVNAEKVKVQKKIHDCDKTVEKSKEDELKRVHKRCKKLEEQNKKLKAELKGLDPGFFEEVEDIKYALRQSAILNKEYEGTLRKLCVQYALPYPHPEKVLNNT